jgi:hypothetical protein
MAEFFEADANGAGFFAIVEEGSEFSFGGTGEYFAHDLAKDIDGTIRRRRGIIRIRWEVWVRRPRTEVLITCGTGPSLGSSEVGGVAFDPEDHVAADEPNSGIGIGGTVVE